MIKVEVTEIEGHPKKPIMRKGETFYLHDEDWDRLDEDEKGKYLLTDDGKSFVRYYLRDMVIEK